MLISYYQLIMIILMKELQQKKALCLVVASCRRFDADATV